MAKITDLDPPARKALLRTILTPDAHTHDIRTLCNIALAIPTWQQNAFDTYQEYELNWYQAESSLRHTKDARSARTINVEKVHTRTVKARSKITNGVIEANIVLDWGRKLVNTSMA